MKYLLCVIVLIAMSCHSKAPDSTNQLKGTNLPSFQLSLMNGKTIADVSKLDTTSKKVIFYFSPDCPYCKAQIRNMLDNIDEFNTIKLFMVSPYPLGNEKSDLLERIASKRNNVMIGYDTTDAYGQFIQANDFPYTVTYTEKNKLINIFHGVTKTSTLIRSLNLN